MISSICYLTAGVATHATVAVAQAPLVAMATIVVLAMDRFQELFETQVKGNECEGSHCETPH